MHTVRAIILIRSSRASANEEHEHTLFGVTYTKKYGVILIYLRVACIIFLKITPCSFKHRIGGYLIRKEESYGVRPLFDNQTLKGLQL